MLAPAAGISKGKDGKLEVKKDDVVPKPVVKSSAQKDSVNTTTTTNSIIEPEDAPAEKATTRSPKKIGVASKIGTAIKGTLRGPS